MIQSLYEKFRGWSDGGSVWLISDPHFNDPDSKLMNPDWPSPEEHLAKINAKVRKNDTLICLGDCGELEWIAKIKAGRKILIKGNHDDKGNSYYKNLFDEVYDGPLFIADRILLSHEPVYGLNFCVNIHGHTHGEVVVSNSHFNIAADVVNWEPLSLGELIKDGLISHIPTIHRLVIDKLKDKHCPYCYWQSNECRIFADPDDGKHYLEIETSEWNDYLDSFNTHREYISYCPYCGRKLKFGER